MENESGREAPDFIQKFMVTLLMQLRGSRDKVDSLIKRSVEIERTSNLYWI